MNEDASQLRVRVFDLALIVLTAPIWLLLLAVISVAVLVTSGRPIHFTQTRTGRGRKPFTIFKFRTMAPGDNPLVPEANRITPIGRFLRRTSLDELPQLINVLIGDMSLVGPRPMPPELSDRVGRDGGGRFLVRPGLTGLAQVNGRNSIPWEARLIFDQRWVDGIGVRLAVRILARTARVVATGNGIDGHDPQDRLIMTAELDPRNAPTKELALDGSPVS